MKPDDISIKESVQLFRRVHPEQVVWDEYENRLRPTKAAFRGEEMSVNLGDDLERERLEPTFALRNHPKHHLVSLTAGFARSEEQAVARSPFKDHPQFGDDPTHGDVNGRKPESRSKRFSLAAEWTVLQRSSLRDEHQARYDQGTYPEEASGDGEIAA